MNYPEPFMTSGFYCAPVLRVILYSTIAVCFAVNMSWVQLGQYIHLSYEPRPKLMHFMMCRLVYPDFREVFLACIIIYAFRTFERRFGSRKFTGYLLFVWMASCLLEVLFVYLLHTFTAVRLTKLATGYSAVLHSLFIPFYCDIPRVPVSNIVGVPFTGKTITYLMAVQLALPSYEAGLLAVTGLLSGLLYRLNFLYVKRWSIIPLPVGQVVDRLLGPVVRVKSPFKEDQQIGATLEIQREQQMERFEQYLINSQTHGNQNRGGFLQNLFGPSTPTASPQLLEQLVSMGFDRERSKQALIRNNNDINRATDDIISNIN